MPRPTHREERRTEIRRRILAAAQESFVSSGIEAVSMRALGARVGLTASALYAYFPAKFDLLRALWWDALDELHSRMAELSRREPDAIAAIRGLGQAYVDFGLENPARFRVLFMVDQGGFAEELKAAGIYHESYCLFHERTAEAIDQGQLRFNDLDLFAQLLWAGVHGALTLSNYLPSSPLGSPSLLAATTIDSLLEGLRRDPSARGP